MSERKPARPAGYREVHDSPNGCSSLARAMASRKEQKERARRERLAREAALGEAARRKRRLTIAGSASEAVIVGVIVAVVAITGGGLSTAQRLSAQGSAPQLKLSSLAPLGHLQPPPRPTALGPEGVPLPAAPALAGSGSMAGGETVGSTQCQAGGQALFHIHAHLAIFVDGAPRQIPQGVGIPGSCVYWLHTHAPDGIIHVEAPVQRTFTLGDFFDIWGQSLGPNKVGPATGPVTAIYNGQLYDGNPRDIPLNAHAQIQLDVSRPLVAPVAVNFAGVG